MPRVLYLSHAPEAVYEIIRREMPAGFELLTLAVDDDAERRAKAALAEVIIVSSTPLRRPVIDAATSLRLVHHQGVGHHDTVDGAALRERGIPLALTPEGTTTGVAEHAVLLALAVCKRLSYADAELRQGRWHINALRPESRELAGMTVGYLGMGRIGQALAARMKAFDTTGLYTDDAAPREETRLFEIGPVEEFQHGIGPIDVPIDRILVGEHAPRKTLADDHDRLRVVAVVQRVEIAAGNDGNAKRRKESGRDDAPFRPRILDTRGMDVSVGGELQTIGTEEGIAPRNDVAEGGPTHAR